MTVLRRLRGGTSNRTGPGLGTFIGVFTPSILTILGVILYLRTGWVVGNVGLAAALVIVVLANTITLATALSVSSVATNMHVGPGGVYYIISRSLGVEIGAAIGIPLFLAQALSITLYAYGLSESLQYVWPDLPQAPVAAATVLVVGLLAARGAGLALRLQLPIMAAIAVSLLVLAIGVALSEPSMAGALDTVADPEPFWTVFAVFFPAVTGIMAGISLSGDLRDPKRSIPSGTIGAVLVGFVVYVLVIIALALAATPEELVSDPLIWFTIAGGAAFLIFPGLWGAIFSSAVGSMLGAPRTLEALVTDRVLPRPIASKLGSVKGPGVPLLITIVIAVAAVALGGLNVVAPVLTMFFLTTYGMVNLAAGLERLSGDPSYRPTLRVPWPVSVVAAFACFWLMFLINPLASFVAFVIELGIYFAMRRRALTAPWGDVRRSALVTLVRSTVLQLRRLPEEPRNWRPNILLFTDDVQREANLARFAATLVQDRGLLTVSKLAIGSLVETGASVAAAVKKLNEDIESLGLNGFGEVDVVPDFEQGVLGVAQANGIAGIASNTVMFGWSRDGARMGPILRSIEQLSGLGKSSVICRTGETPLRSSRRRIDVWWGGLQHNGDLLVLFAHLISLDPTWRDAEIRVKSVAINDMIAERTQGSLETMIRASRIRADCEVILKPTDVRVQDVISENSRDSDVVLMGLRSNAPGEEYEYTDRLVDFMSGLRNVLLVRNAGPFRGQLLGVEADKADLA